MKKKERKKLVMLIIFTFIAGKETLVKSRDAGTCVRCDRTLERKDRKLLRADVCVIMESLQM